ncbi:MAG: PEP/pyruvate-binding domain-containing protein [Anaerolineaceae bacterium]|nr:PEP/pyruvate-binding domain-containing protein [Anaerolineaceae bacterium]
MSIPHKTSERLLSIYLTMGQYPILSQRIHIRMRKYMFSKGITDEKDFEERVREAAIQSQLREGLQDPQIDETEDLWELRIQKVRDQLTDVTFSRQLPFEEFERILNEVLSEQGVEEEDPVLSMNPELASREQVFQQAKLIERMPEEQRARYEPRLEESKVVLIRSIISEQLRYINIAKDWFSIADLMDIRQRKIGAGRIGGKAAGMLLAHSILSQKVNPELRKNLRIPESYFIGATEFYPFMSINGLMHWLDQKYKDEDQMRSEFPQIMEEFESGELHQDLSEKLIELLVKIGNKPLIVRSSSLLEDNFGTAFAGKYDSVFLPNQGTLEENLKALTCGVGHIYGSAVNPNALLYRRQRGLQDYDERMGILIQVVEGEAFGPYYMPHAAGVAFSRNYYRWNPQIKSDNGFVRLVWGLGTRAVDRVGNDYPRLIALSHPLLRPSNDPKSIRRYSQQFIDLIDLEENCIKTMSVKDVLDPKYPPLRYIAQLDKDGYFSSIRSRMIDTSSGELVITFDSFLQRTSFAEQMREILQILEGIYAEPVDMEFALKIDLDTVGSPEINYTILQCRPQSRLEEKFPSAAESIVDRDKLIFESHFVVPQGYLDKVEYVVFIPHEAYYALPEMHHRIKLARTIGKVNAALKDQSFVFAGPGRWGSSNSDLGVPVDYGDIYNSQALIELAGKGVGVEPEPSLGTHFFQDLMEAQIFPLAIFFGAEKTLFNHDFFYETPNRVEDWIEIDALMKDCLRVIRVSDFEDDHFLRIIMDSQKAVASAFLVKN